ncbi:sigma factor-like helix-turn-helix DNA-binding protein [Nocardia sp. NPDC046473]|uniref:sigma factor-like helix-turn-helix DNA-binding protein n=1 Tax=Nocardia sp. NPDC046473 TaxID=3155733 RepID=UPI003411B0E1
MTAGWPPDRRRTVGEQDRLSVANAVAALPDPQRRIIVIVYYRRLSCPEAANAARVPESVVKQLLHDGLHAIRAHLARAL